MLPRCLFFHKKTSKAPPVQFDHADYAKSLEIILKAAQEDYKQITYERHTRQQLVLRTYLWLASVLMAAEVTLLGHVVKPVMNFVFVPWVVLPTPYFYFWTVLALLCTLGCFVLGVDSLRGRGMIHFPYDRSYDALMQLAFQAADDSEDNRSVEREALHIAMIRHLDTAISHQRAQANSKGKKLRTMSYSLLLSVFLTACALAPAF